MSFLSDRGEGWALTREGSPTPLESGARADDGIASSAEGAGGSRRPAGSSGGFTSATATLRPVAWTLLFSSPPGPARQHPWRYITRLKWLCFAILGAGFSLSLSLKSKRQVQRLTDWSLTALAGMGRPWGGGRPGARAFGGAPSLSKDVKPHVCLWGLSFTSCQGQTPEDYFLFWKMVVI